MTATEKVITTHAQEANHSAERAYWWIKGINRDEAQRLGVLDKVQTVLGLLQEVDSITMDIVITIKQKSECRQ